MRCPACGSDNNVSDFYCKKCGANLKGVTKVGEENYLGGVYSPSIGKDKIWDWKFAVHATDRRLLAVSASGGLRRAGWGIANALGGVADALSITSHVSQTYVRSFKPEKSKEKNTQIIQALDGSPKEFELLREDIERIDMKKPGIIALHHGYIKIIPQSGSEINLNIRDRTAFDRLKKLMIAFFPEASTVNK
ncbi:MAG: zinc ribbon domain-containing protein [Candidatus Atabeyarchaeum deiterrae]